MPVLATPLTRSVVLRSAATGGPPGGITDGLILWLEGDQAGLADGASVSSWTDRSSAANHAVQATGTKQPTYRATGGPNSLPTVEFDGGDALATGNMTFAGQVGTYYVVVSVSVDGTDQIIIERSANYNTNAPGFLASRISTNKVYCGHKGNAGLADKTSVANLQSTPMLVSCVMNRAASSDETMPYLNGTVFAAGTNANNTDSLGSSHPLYIGSRATTSIFLTGKITLILVYDAAHDATTRGAIQTAINTKYNLGF
jgi:hypothetical protein